MVEPIKSMDFCVVASNKRLQGSGLEPGDIVMVSSTKVAQAKASDPYLQRIYVVVMKVVDDILQVPKEDNDYKAYLVDPRNLTKMGKEDQDRYKELLDKQYATPDRR